MSKTICVVGLGYVGLPLALEFSKHFRTIGYDRDVCRIEMLKKGIDVTNETSEGELKKSKLELTWFADSICEADIIIVAVPTPVDANNVPNLNPLKSVSEGIGKRMKRGAVVVYESTVYPGATEEVCIPILEAHSGLEWQKDFNVGYSPERINPGDKVHTLTNITKIVSGDTDSTATLLKIVYGTIIEAGIHVASSIRVAEAAKVIENTQRDINIAFMNELKMIFDEMHIDTNEVLEAAKTKWNFLPFEPGLVGGHCIGVDPYYLAYKAEEYGLHPEIIKAGRRVNDNMARYHATKIIHKLIDSGVHIKDAEVLVLGITFKENCPDIRNTKVIDLIRELEKFGVNVSVVDPVANVDEVKEEYGIVLGSKPISYDIAVLAVKHDEFVKDYSDGVTFPEIIYDIKGVLGK